MAEDREKISTGPNERAVNEPIAGLPRAYPTMRVARARNCPSSRAREEVQRIAEQLGAATEGDGK
jgi:hypothetical protein